MAGNRIPGPICQVSNPVEIDPGTSARHRSPAPGPVCRSRLPYVRAALAVDAVVFDEDQIISFLESVAHAKIAERYIKLVWKDYKESIVLNVIYAIMPKGKPGLVEVDPGDIRQITADTRVESQKLQEQFLHAAARGAPSVIRFLDGQEQIRRTCLGTIESAYRDARQLNADMANEARRGVARLALIKAASTITLKTAALAGAGLPAFLIGMGYDVSLKLITDWNKAPQAKLVGVTSKVADKIWKKGLKDAAKNMAYILKQEESAPAHKAEWLSKRVAAMEKELEKRANLERLKKLGRDSRRLMRAEHDAARARWGANTLSSIKFIFFAWDLYSAAQDARSTFQSAGYGSSWSAIGDAF
jgi:hypothetical protein